MKFQYLRPVLSTMAMLIGFTLIAAPTAHAADRSVTCDGTTDDATIAAALVALKTADEEFNTLDITGNCSLLHTITIQNFSSIAINAPSGTATLSMPVVACDTTSSPLFIVLAVISTRNVSLRHFNITGGAGVLVKDSDGVFTDVSITNSRGQGLSVQGSSTLGLLGATLTGSSPGTLVPTPNSITGNCGDGLSVGPGSSVNVARGTCAAP